MIPIIREPLQEVPAYRGNMHLEEIKDKRPKALVRGSKKPGATEWTNSVLCEERPKALVRGSKKNQVLPIGLIGPGG